MAEEYDLTEALSKADTRSTKDRERKARNIKLVTMITGGVAIAAVFTLALTGFFTRTDFNTPVTFDEDVSRWDVFSFSYGDNKNIISNQFGDWVDGEDDGVFKNDEIGCVIRLNKFPGAAHENTTNDKDATEQYAAIFKTGAYSIKDTLLMPVEGFESGVELAKINYKTNEDADAVGYFRVNKLSDMAYSVVVTCDDVDKIADVTAGGFEGLGLKFRV